MTGSHGPRWPLLVVALLCLVPAVWGALWAFGGEEGSEALGLALAGFFGAGFVVLAKQAFNR